MRKSFRGWAYGVLAASVLTTMARAESTERDPILPGKLKLATDEVRPAAKDAPVSSPVPRPIGDVTAPAPNLNWLENRPQTPANGFSSSAFSAGAGILFLTPYLSSNTAYTILTPTAPAAPGVAPLAIGSALTESFDYRVGCAYQVWAGWTDSCGLGVRAGAFCYNRDSERLALDPVVPQVVTVPPAIPAIPGAAGFGSPSVILAGGGLGIDHMVFESDLEIHSVDLQLTYECGGDDFLAVVSGGARWTCINHTYRARLTNPGDGVTFETQELRFEQEFCGCGPTAGLFLRHGICATGLAVYGSVRGSILVGQIDRTGTFAQDVSDPTFAALAGSQQTRTRFDDRSDHILTVAEIELGLEYGVRMGDSRVFFRGGVVSQSYIGGGNATSSTGTLNLLGGLLAAGINY